MTLSYSWIVICVEKHFPDSSPSCLDWLEVHVNMQEKAPPSFAATAWDKVIESSNIKLKKTESFREFIVKYIRIKNDY